MNLTVTTPLAVVLEETGVISVRAEDASGGFGIWPGHADFLTLLGASVMRWKKAEGGWQFCALRGGVLRVSGGSSVEIACRAAVVGDDLARLEADVRAENEARDAAARQARGERTRLHAVAIRHLMQRLEPESNRALDALTEDFL
jgi:F-type H+-transporting ATPase subunit epsilon